MRYKQVSLVGAAPEVMGDSAPAAYQVKAERSTPVYIVSSDLPVASGTSVRSARGVRDQRAIPIAIKAADAPLGVGAPPSLVRQERSEPWYITGTNGVFISGVLPNSSDNVRPERATPVHIAGAAESVVSGASLPSSQVIDMDPIPVYIDYQRVALDFPYTFADATADKYPVYMEYFAEVAQRNQAAGVTATYSEVGDISDLVTTYGAEVYRGGVYCPTNQRMYLAPRKGRRVLKVNPFDYSWEEVGGDLSGIASQWVGGTFGPDGKIYWGPYVLPAYVLVLDPADDSTTLIDASSVVTENGAYGIGFHSNDPDGAIYFGPRAANNFLKLRLSDYNLSTLSYVNSQAFGFDVSGHCLGADGLLYSSSFNNSHPIVVTNPADDSQTTISGAFGNQYVGLIPWRNTLRRPYFNDVASFTRTCMTIDNYSSASRSFKYVDNVPWIGDGTNLGLMHNLCANGVTYSVSQTGNNHLTWNLEAGQTDTDGVVAIEYPNDGSLDWYGSVPGPYGTSLFFVPYGGSTFLKVTLSENAIGLPDHFMSTPFWGFQW